MFTAGRPHHIEIMGRDGECLKADGKDLYYWTVSVVDENGNLCPDYNGLLHFKVTGEGTFRAAANGDPTSLESFQSQEMHAFHGQLTVIVQSTRRAGVSRLTVTGKGLQKGLGDVLVEEVGSE